MNYQSIDEIYEANDRASERLIETLKRLTAEQANKIVDGEKWSPAHLVEHVAIVEGGMAAICAKLLKKAEAAGVAAAAVGVSENFVTKGAELAVMKVQAPEMVEPTGTQSVEDSLARLEASRAKFEELRPVFSSVNGSEFKFPHPFLGEMSAIEWLVLAGEHKRRHTAQLKAMMAKF